MDEEAAAHELLGMTRAAVRRTRAARRGFWFPLVLFGVLVIAATPWYRTPTPACGAGLCTISRAGDVWAATLYWLVAGGIGYAITVGYYRWHAARVGVAGRVWPYIATGVGLLAVTVACTPGVDNGLLRGPWQNLAPFEVLHGMMPLLAVALGLFVLARLERSLPLMVFAAFFLAVSLVANLYDVQNLTAQVGWIPSDQWHLLPNLWLAGLTLLLGGLGFGLPDLLRRRRSV
jgi:hypothetical protein